jgi:[ribosomal protein S5]-alanine N-acetyltransferase
VQSLEARASPSRSVGVGLRAIVFESQSVSVRLESTRLIIRTFEQRDAEPWLAMMTDPDVRRFLPPGPAPTAESFDRAIERRHAMERERGYAIWAVDVKETGAFIGQCGLYPVEGTGPEVEIAYHYDKGSWNKGYATEAAIAVLEHALGSIGLDRVIAIVFPENVASCRVVEKAGMRFEHMATYYGIEGLRKYVAERRS